MIDLLERWWPAGAAALGGIMAFRMGQARNQWRIEQVERRLDQIDRDLRDIKAAQVVDAGTLGRLTATMEQILQGVKDLRAELNHKMDK